MNYQQSKQEVNPVQNDTPALLADLKNRLSAFTEHDIPFFLMPVRLETRFMKVEKNLLLESEQTPVKTGEAFTAAKDFTVSLQSLKNYRGFQGVDSDAFNAEIRKEVFNVQDAFDEEILKSLSKTGLESVADIFNSLKQEALAVQENIQAQTLNDPKLQLLLDGIEETHSIIGSKLDTIREQLDAGNYDNSWQQEVNPEFRDTLKDWQEGALHELSQRIKNHPEDAEAYYAYQSKVSELLNFLKKQASFITSYDKEYFVETFKPIFSEQLSDISIGLRELDGNGKAQVGGLVYQVRLNIEKSFTSLWIGNGAYLHTERIAFLAKQGDLFSETPDPSNLPEQLMQVGADIESLKQELDRLVIRVSESENVESFERDLQSYENYLEQIGLVLGKADIAETPDELNYLYAILKPIDGSIDTLLGEAAKKGEVTDRIPSLLSSINAQGFVIGYELNELAKVDFVNLTSFSLTQTVEELWIRVYPDDIAITSHEEKLTPNEIISGDEYWKVWSFSNGNPAIQLKAWQTLATAYGPERAAWIVKSTAPANLPDIAANFSAVYQLFPQLAALTTYTIQLNAISRSPSQQTILSNPQWELFVPSLESASNKVESLKGVPAPEYEELDLTFKSFAENFDLLAESAMGIPPLEKAESRERNFSPEGPVEATTDPAKDKTENREEPDNPDDPENPIPPVKEFVLEETLQEIRARIEFLGDRISRVPIIDSWPVIDPHLVFETETKDGNFTEAAYSNVLPDRFLFATVGKHTPDTTKDPIEDPLFGSYSFGHIKIGNLIPAKLPTGIDPVKGTYGLNSLGQLQIDPQIKWMFDFKEAVKVGMGIEIPLVGTEFKDGFDIVLAFGLKLGESNKVKDSSELAGLGKTLLEELLEGHHYTPGGLSITEVGTPTNNTDSQSTPFGVEDQDYKTSFGIEVQAPLFSYVQQQELTGKRDGQLLAEALGINHTIFQHIANAGGKQISNAISMNRALYNGTIGSYMRDMMGFLFTDKNVENTQDYFTDYVLGRGTVPGIRVGRQPYAILPATAFGRWEWKRLFWSELKGEQFYGIELFSLMIQEYEYLLGEEESNKYFQDRYHIRLDFVMEKLNQTWENISNWHVTNVTRHSDKQQSDFLNILGLEASLAESYSQIFTSNKSFIEDTAKDISYKRKYFNDYSPNLVWEDNGDLPTLLRKLFGDYSIDVGNYTVTHSASSDGTVQIGLLTPDDAKRGLIDITDFSNEQTLLIDNKDVTNALRIFNAKFLEERFLLYGAKTAERQTLNGFLPPYLGGNYISWLKDSSLEAIWKDNRFALLPSRSLLFLLLRQSALNTYKETAWDILEKDYVFRKSARKIIGSPEGINMQQNKAGLDPFILTKWHFLFNSLDNLLDPGTSGDVSYVVDYFMKYPQNFSNSPSALTEYHKNADSLAQELFEHYRHTPFTNPSAHGHRSVNGVNVNPEWSEIKLSLYLKGLISPSQNGASRLKSLLNKKNILSLQNAFSQLANCKTAELDKLMREHIDLCSYRLDAWNTGKVNKRLWENRRTDKSLPRQARKTGVYLGSYGWLFDVRPKGPDGIQEVKAAHLPDKLTNNAGKVYYDPETLGFIQTPSMAHALTAALLRAGYDSERHQEDSRFAINLSSNRVSKALKLVDGIHNGQTLSALIGYDFERGLHENHPTLNLDYLIYKLRRVFPLVDPNTSQVIDPATGQIKPQSSVPVSNTANLRANLVIDGVALINNIRNSSNGFSALIKKYPQKTFYQLYAENYSEFALAYSTYRDGLKVDGQFILPALSSNNVDETKAFIQEIDKAIDAIDGLGDLAVAEGVFQIARGNTDRAGSVLQAWSEGKNPADPEIVKTPKTGTHIAHRLAVALEKTNPSFNPWSGVPLTPRAIAEPSVNKWIAQTLDAYKSNSSTPFVDLIGCTVTYTDDSGLTTQSEVTLRDLKIQPIDLLLTVTPDGFSDELNKRIRFFMLSQPSAPVNLPIQIDYSNTTNAQLIAFTDIHSILFATQSVLNKARALNADDFMSVTPYPLNAGVPEFDIAELKDRINNLIAALGSLNIEFGTIAGFSSDPLLEAGKLLLLKASTFNLPQSIPENVPESISDQQGVEDLWKLFGSIKETISSSLTSAQHKASHFNSSSHTTTIDDLIETAKIILGDKFLIVSHFSFNKYQNLRNEVNATLYPATAAHDILHPDSNAPEALIEDWIFGLARVNDTVSHIETIRLLSGAGITSNNQTVPFRQMRPVQFPYEAARGQNPVYWLGVEYPQNYKPKNDSLSIAVFNYGNFDLSSISVYNCGLILDNWEEIIPDAEVITGVTFSYDQPSAQPPQTILLAVNPQVVQDLDPNYKDTRKSWRLGDLLHTLLDTIDLAKMRMVEPDSFRMATAADKNPYITKENNAAKVSSSNPDINADENKDAKDTQYFEIFKWLLPAVVGEITPIVDDPYKHYGGSADSVQQVSFDYNPNNDTPSKADGTSIDPTLSSIHNWDTIAAREVLGNDTTKEFLLEQERLGQLASTQQQLKDILS